MPASIRILLALLSLLLLSLVILLSYAIDDKPAVSEQWKLTHQDIQRVKQIVNAELSDKSTMATLELTEKDLNLAVNYLLNLQLESTSKVILKESELNFISSIKLPLNPFGQFLNIQFNFVNNEISAQLKNLIIGALAIPDTKAAFIFDMIISDSPLQKYQRLAKQHVKAINISANALTINYQSDSDTLSKVRSLLTHDIANEAVAVYQQKLLTIIADHDHSWRLSLADLLQPLFLLAYQRSDLESAIEENRNVIFIVSAYVNNREMHRFFPQLLPSLPGYKYPVFLYKRVDMAKHFIGSAALTASAGGAADMLGLEKELRDSHQGGSGFSFIDLAADRAGMYFGKKATSSPQNARKIQLAMGKIKDYTAFMPDVRDLPEQIEVTELKKQYVSVDSQAAKDILTKIDERIAASPIYND